MQSAGSVAQDYCQTPGFVFILVGVDFALPLSQYEEAPPHQNLSEGGVLEGFWLSTGCLK